MFIEQAIRLVTQTPDNLAYHILTLLAVQAALALSLWQWRQRPSDTFAGRLAGAAVLIFLLRVLLAFVLATTSQSDLLAVLPPLERALDMALTAALIWAFVPSLPAAPRLSEILLFFALVAIAVAYVLAGPSWAGQLAQGVGYTQTAQAGAWNIAQLAVLGIGLLLVLVSRPHDWALRGLVLLLLGGAHLAHLLGIGAVAAGVLETAVPYWVRLSYLVIMPLLAVLAYRHTLAEVLDSQWGTRPLGEQFAILLDLASGMLRQPNSRTVLHGAVNLAARIMGANFAAVGTLTGESPTALATVSWQKDDTLRGGRTWMLNTAEWPGIQLAMRQRTAVELLPNGLGARQLFALYQELGLANQGAMLIEPLFGPNEEQVGVLLLGGPPNTPAWTADDKALIPHLGRHIAYALAQVRQLETAAPPPISHPTLLPSPAHDEQVAELTAERDKAIGRTLALTDYVQEARETLHKREVELAELQAEREQWRTQPSQVQLAALQDEVSALRESLRQAEEAMALASAGEVGLSAEWVMLTITHYSAELEQAQRRIQQLEAQLGQTKLDHSTRSIIAGVGEALRQPLAAMAGYTELLLNEKMGLLTPKQRNLLEQTQASTSKMESLLERIAHGETELLPPVADLPAIDLATTLETAVSDLLPHLREKQVVLEVQVSEGLPPLPLPADVVQRIVAHLLANALKVTPADGRITLSARTRQWQEPTDPEPLNFVQVTVADGGVGIPATLRPFVFNPRVRRNGSGRIPGLSDDPGVLQAHQLAQLVGGRIWVESEEEVGSTFYVLLPI